MGWAGRRGSRLSVSNTVGSQYKGEGPAGTRLAYGHTRHETRQGIGQGACGAGAKHIVGTKDRRQGGAGGCVMRAAGLARRCAEGPPLAPPLAEPGRRGEQRAGRRWVKGVSRANVRGGREKKARGAAQLRDKSRLELTRNNTRKGSAGWAKKEHSSPGCCEHLRIGRNDRSAAGRRGAGAAAGAGQALNCRLPAGPSIQAKPTCGWLACHGTPAGHLRGSLLGGGCAPSVPSSWSA